MINIRAITLGFDIKSTSKKEAENNITSFNQNTLSFFKEKNINVRTNRLVLTPVNSWDKINLSSANVIVKWISELCEESGIRWFCLPFTPITNANSIPIYDIATECIRRYKNCFLNFIVAQNYKINVSEIHNIAKFMLSISRLSNNGYDNFRVGVSCNCEANGPFFPYTYHKGENGFSLALELPRVFINIIKDNNGNNIEIIREQLIKYLVPEIKKIEKYAIEIEKITNMKYLGIDLALAPFPEDENSVAEIIELLGAEVFGSYGTLFLISFLTDILKQLIKKSGIKSIGFNGVMLSLLEDKQLCINNKRLFTIDTLLTLSAVCGCGIDMIPIPGNTFQEEISSLILDTAALSSVLKKPLGIRLLPIPAKRENEFTEFNYDFLYNSRVMEVRNRICDFNIFHQKKRFEYLHY